MKNLEYKEIKIGNQTWMAENLNITTFRNGELIPETNSCEEWRDLGLQRKPVCMSYWQPCHVSYPNLNEKYGKLYNWHCINDPRGFAPYGWHIPSDKEWSILIAFIREKGMSDELKEFGKYNWKLFTPVKEQKFFKSHHEMGYLDFGGYFNFDQSIIGIWWSSKEDDSYISRDGKYKYDALSQTIAYLDTNTKIFGYSKRRGFHVRCLKD